MYWASFHLLGCFSPALFLFLSLPSQITLTQPPPSGLTPDSNNQVTAEQFIIAYYPSWDYAIIGCVLALCLIIAGTR